jgi:hypothetical protein
MHQAPKIDAPMVRDAGRSVQGAIRQRKRVRRSRGSSWRKTIDSVGKAVSYSGADPAKNLGPENSGP